MIPPGGGPGMAPGGPMGPGGQFGTMYGQQYTNTELEHVLLRFTDSDVAPGYSYQYRVQVRMRNPNYKQAGIVSRPDDAKQEILVGPWAEIQEIKTIPPETFLYAFDPEKFLENVQKFADENGKEGRLKRLMEYDDVRDGKRTVVQVQRWTPQIRIDGSGNKTEPVGTWVVSEMAVGPGEYIGKRQIVELPLWSAGLANYVLRELSAGVKVAFVDPKNQPKGWPVNFRSETVLVDFEGGHKKYAVAADQTVQDTNAATELLILRPDGKLLVRNSSEDFRDKDRAQRNEDWSAWLARVKQRKDVQMQNPMGPPGGGTFFPGGSPGGGDGR
jgi:hypothetical protein